MKTLKDATVEDLKAQYQQILNRIAEAKKAIDTNVEKIKLLENERHYFLGIIEYVASKEVPAVPPVKVVEPLLVPKVEPEKKSDATA